MDIKIYFLHPFDAIDGNIWIMDELRLNSMTQLQLMVNLKTKFVLGFALSSESFTPEMKNQFFQKISHRYDENNTIEIQSRQESNQIIFDFIGEEIKTQITLESIQKDSRALRQWRKTVPKIFKSMSKKNKSQDTEFQRLLFDSDYFQQIRLEIIARAIETYNTLHLASVNETVRKEENDSTMLLLNGSIDEKIDEMTNLVLQDQSQTRTIMKQGFVGLARQNEELWKQNQELQQLVQSLREETNFLQKDLKFVRQQLQEKFEQERLMEEKRQRRKNRKRLPKRQPITSEIYQTLIKDSEKLSYAKSYRGARLRLALALMAVTGVRVSELLPIKMGQVKSLFKNHWIAIDRLKKGPANHKAFLTKEGKKLIQDRKKDFEFLSFSKKEDSYMFTAEGSEKPLERESFTNMMNQFIRDSARKMEENPNLTTHSFRIGFITKLWKDNGDIEFVRQVIGHRNVSTTSLYVGPLSEQERQQRMESMEDSSE